MWAEMTSSAQRSINACESFHNKYNSNFSSTPSHIYTCLDLLKSMQLDTIILISSFKMETKTTIGNLLANVEIFYKYLNLYTPVLNSTNTYVSQTTKVCHEKLLQLVMLLIYFLDTR